MGKTSRQIGILRGARPQEPAYDVAFVQGCANTRKVSAARAPRNWLTVAKMVRVDSSANRHRTNVSLVAIILSDAVQHEPLREMREVVQLLQDDAPLFGDSAAQALHPVTLR